MEWLTDASSSSAADSGYPFFDGRPVCALHLVEREVVLHWCAPTLDLVAVASVEGRYERLIEGPQLTYPRKDLRSADPRA